MSTDDPYQTMNPLNTDTDPSPSPSTSSSGGPSDLGFFFLGVASSIMLYIVVRIGYVCCKGRNPNEQNNDYNSSRGALDKKSDTVVIAVGDKDSIGSVYACPPRFQATAATTKKATAEPPQQQQPLVIRHPNPMLDYYGYDDSSLPSRPSSLIPEDMFDSYSAGFVEEEQLSPRVMSNNFSNNYYGHQNINNSNRNNFNNGVNQFHEQQYQNRQSIVRASVASSTTLGLCLSPPHQRNIREEESTSLSWPTKTTTATTTRQPATASASATSRGTAGVIKLSLPPPPEPSYYRTKTLPSARSSVDRRFLRRLKSADSGLSDLYSVASHYLHSDGNPNGGGGNNSAMKSNCVEVPLSSSDRIF